MKRIMAWIFAIAILVTAVTVEAVPPQRARVNRRWQTRARVNTKTEKKYDKNGNGWLEPAEVKEMLQDKYTIVKTEGKAIVDTPLEAEYDTNKDGVIDSDEAVAMADDIR